MDIKIIRTEKEYEEVLARIDQLGDPEPGTPEGDEFEILCMLIERYEDEHYPIGPPDPIEAIKFRMEQMGYKAKDLEKILGSKSHVSEILNRKRKLSLTMIRKLHKELNISANVLVQEYD